ncbi:cysteine rich repeat-containing protein [Methyloligella sp. 2.7D]|uniref:cysteine rich repeat-containing protein n=1 Tax=unclassified Methyloligella TaxID=2625955 RepID=UPI001FEFDC0D|nr:cysteine rich repeat-containing protein [Methyloligella sp. GL2]
MLELQMRSLCRSGAFAAAALALGLTGTPATAFNDLPPEMRQEAAMLMKLCREDYKRLCRGTQPGGGRVLACLQNQNEMLSDGCTSAMPRAEALKQKAIAAGVMPQ